MNTNHREVLTQKINAAIERVSAEIAFNLGKVDAGKAVFANSMGLTRHIVD
jgi:hypothetical protein